MEYTAIRRAYAVIGFVTLLALAIVGLVNLINPSFQVCL